jgi:hypothetical protein
MTAHAASTRISPMAESSAAFRSACPPGGRARFRLGREERLARYEERAAQSHDTIASRAFAAGNSCGAPARTSRSIWTEPALSCCHDRSVRHFASDRVPADVRRLTRSASAQRPMVALASMLSRDTTTHCPAIRHTSEKRPRAPAATGCADAAAVPSLWQPFELRLSPRARDGERRAPFLP